MMLEIRRVAKEPDPAPPGKGELSNLHAMTSLDENHKERT
jgi:hypothetical protein